MLWLGLGTPIREQTNRSQESRRHGQHFVHVLSLETLAITQIEQSIVGQTAARHVIKGEAGNYDSNLVRVRAQNIGDVDRIRRAPSRCDSLIFDINTISP